MEEVKKEIRLKNSHSYRSQQGKNSHKCSKLRK